MSDVSLTKLESQIDGLLNSCQTLRQENQSLRVRLEQITIERAQLIEKNQTAAASVKRIIAQIKDEAP